MDLSGFLLSAAIEKDHALTFNLLSELAGTLEENNVESIGTVVQSVSRTAQQLPDMLGWMRVLKKVFWWGLLAITVAGLA